MAIDTRAKRFSLMSMGRPWVPRLPVPDGTIDAGDRRELIFRYAGALAAVVVVIGNARSLSTARSRPRAVLVSDE